MHEADGMTGFEEGCPEEHGDLGVRCAIISLVRALLTTLALVRVLAAHAPLEGVSFCVRLQKTDFA